MPLQPGASLGPYAITAKIGEGGMGEVYQAHDTSLGRDVALKVLPASLAAYEPQLGTLRREAEALATLNHPNISAIYGLEQTDETCALVLELVDGPTLADLLPDGPLSVGEALRFARQVAEGLEAAHEAGVIHRDLKPANIKVKPDGTVKILDFGLSKVLDPNLPENADDGQTVTTTITGTPAYMSPEQTRGGPPTKRDDIWALACVLFEMLTGTRAFAGSSVVEIIRNVTEGEPDWDTLPDGTPPVLRRLMVSALQKEPRVRPAHVAAARFAIDEALSATGQPDSIRPRRAIPRLTGPTVFGCWPASPCWRLSREARRCGAWWVNLTPSA